MLQLLRGRHGTTRKVALFDLEIGVQPGLMLRDEPAQFLIHSVRANHGLRAKLDQQLRRDRNELQGTRVSRIIY